MQPDRHAMTADADRNARLRASALAWMEDEGPLLVNLDGPTEKACAAAATMMEVCRGMVDDGLCTEDVIGEMVSVFAITQKGCDHDR